MSKKIVSMQLNGKTVEEAVEPRTLLIHFLREKMNLTGAHIGCETSHCGACGGPIAGFALELLVAVARASSKGRDQDGSQDFVFGQRGHIGAVGKVHRFDLARALGALQFKSGIQRHGDGRMVIARVAVGNIAADGAAVAHLRIGDQQRRFGQQG